MNQTIHLDKSTCIIGAVTLIALAIASAGSFYFVLYDNSVTNRVVILCCTQGILSFFGALGIYLVLAYFRVALVLQYGHIGIAHV